jgi:hypothetical protein
MSFAAQIQGHSRVRDLTLDWIFLPTARKTMIPWALTPHCRACLRGVYGQDKLRRHTSEFDLAFTCAPLYSELQVKRACHKDKVEGNRYFSCRMSDELAIRKKEECSEWDPIAGSILGV